MRRDEVERKIRANLEELHNEYKVKSLSLFGSVARGEERPDSDIDLLVEFDDDVDLFGYVRTHRYLENLLSESVDLVFRQTLKPLLRESVFHDEVPIE